MVLYRGRCYSIYIIEEATGVSRFFHLTGGTAPAAALLLLKIIPVLLVVALCIRGPSRSETCTIYFEPSSSKQPRYSSSSLLALDAESSPVYALDLLVEALVAFVLGKILEIELLCNRSVEGVTDLET